MRKLLVFAALLAMAAGAQAQSGAVFFGASGIKGTSSTSSSSIVDQQVGGGTFLSGGGQFLLKGNFGVLGEVTWRAHQNLYQGVQPFRPIFYDFNALYAPSLGDRVAADLMAGIGAESLRFYQGTYVCSFTGCTNYVSSNHFMGHFGAGLRFNVHNGLFIRPEVHLYLVRNNVEFSSGHAIRAGASIGYQFGER